MTLSSSHCASLYAHNNKYAFQRQNITRDGLGISDTAVDCVTSPEPAELGALIIKLLTPPPQIVARPSGFKDPIPSVLGLRSSRMVAQKAKHVFLELSSNAVFAFPSIGDSRGGFTRIETPFDAPLSSAGAVGSAVLVALEQYRYNSPG